MEQSPFVKLHRLTDAAELLTRFVAAILLSDLLRQRRKFPTAVRKALAEKIERPTFGAWKDILKLSCDELPARKGQTECFVAELPAFVKTKLLPALGTGEGDAAKQIIALRNILAHQGRLSDEQAAEILEQHREAFESLLAGLEVLAKYDLIACASDGRILSLRGFPQKDGSFRTRALPQSTKSLQPERVALWRETEWLDMFPLQSFSEVFQWREEKMMRIADAIPQIYFRLSNKGYLEFTPMSDSVPLARQRGAALDRFRELFRLEEWRRLNEAEQLRREFAFDELLAGLGEVFVGREEQVRHVKESVKAFESGVLWLTGKPGVGKSALMARLARDYQGAAQHYVVIHYFFRIGHFGCSTGEFLRAALLHLGKALDEAFSISPNPEERRLQFIEAVRRVTERLDKKVLFLIDGLDEIYRLEPNFVSLLFAASGSKVVWLCAGRPEPAELEQELERSGASRVFPEGLPEMTEQGIRSMLTAHLERLKYQLFARDEMDESAWHNRFIEVLVRKSEGLPLYVRMAIEDLREGNWSAFSLEHYRNCLTR